MARVKQSLIAALGVTFGIGVFISMIGFMTGLNKLMDDLMLNNTPHIRLYNDMKVERKSVLEESPEFKDDIHVVHHQRPKEAKRKIRNALHIIEQIKEDPRVLGVAPRLSTQVFYDFGSVQLNGSILGIDVVQEQILFNLKDNMLEGEVNDLAGTNNGAIIGSGLAKKLSVGIGDRVNLTSSTGVQFQLKVVGIFQIGISAIDDIQGYTTLKTAQRILGESKDFISDINIKLKDIRNAKDVAAEYARRFEVTAVDYKTANAQMELGMNVRNIMTYVVGIALLIVAGFGIYNILNMFIFEKMDDIAILKATGFSKRDIHRIFIAEAMITGLVGGVLGLIVGFLISYGIDNIPFEQTFMPALKTFPVNYDPKYYIIGITFALITTFFAGYLPARKAGKIDPVEIIRGK
jgi:lipoprotein-releasing system permease protein